MIAAPTATDGIAIETVDLAKRYGRIVALAGLSMRIERGAIFGFLGPNGAGKTTAVKLLLGLARPTAGEAWVFGAPVSDERAHRATRAKVGYLPELFRYPGWLTAREVLASHCALAGMVRPAWDGSIREALATVGLTDRADDRVQTFSKGMQQRLGLGVALLGSPELVVLDEPTSALDPVGRHDVREILRALRARGTTVFLNSHLLSEVEQVCDRVAVVDHGRVIVTGQLGDLLRSDSVRLRAAGVTDAVRAALARFGWTLDGIPAGGSGIPGAGPSGGVTGPSGGVTGPSGRIGGSAGGEQLLVRGVAQDRVPDLVEALVAAGVRIYAIEPARESLEERFLALLREG